MVHLAYLIMGSRSESRLVNLDGRRIDRLTIGTGELRTLNVGSRSDLAIAWCDFANETRLLCDMRRENRLGSIEYQELFAINLNGTTPQAFPRALLVDAYEAWSSAGGALGATDDAAVVEANGGRVVVVDGDPENLKVTEPADVMLATALLGRRAPG